MLCARGARRSATLFCVPTSLPLLVVADPPHATHELIAALARAGASPHGVADLSCEVLARELAAHRPALVLAMLEPGSRQLAQLDRALGVDPSRAFTPVALVSTRRDLAPFASQLRSGVVALWEPGSAASVVQRVFTLMAELPRRSGQSHAGLSIPERALLWEFLRSTRRTGALRLGPEKSGDGTALLVNGELQEARSGELTGTEALRAILTHPREPLTFCEVSGFPGAGASVVLRIDAPDDELPVLTGQLVEEPEEEPRVRGIPLLLVDDDPELCRMFSILFRRHGFEVTTASDGVEGYEKACTSAFALIVADLNMPRMDGWGLLRLLREDFRTRELPVAFLSCHDDYRESLKALNSGAQAYFSKSLRLEALAAQVRSLLEPATRLRAQLSRGEPTALPLQQLGAQTVLWMAQGLSLTGLIEARDGFSSYQVVLDAGAPRHASMQSGRHVVQGERAFQAFVASRDAQGQFTPGPSFVQRSLLDPLPVLLARAQAALNAHEQQLREVALIEARHVSVDPALYEVYAQVGPRAWLETARLICEERLPPREVIGRVELSPIEVEETIRDLVRRGVVNLRA